MFFGGNPFENMGGGHFGSEMGQANIDNNEYYDILGVDKDASPASIKKAFRKLAMKNHPDRGGDEEKFKKIQQAYEVLSDNDKKETYDRFGKEGVEQGGGASSSHDIFSSIFGGASRNRNQVKRGENITHPLNCSLEDLYNGKKIKLAVTRNVKADPNEESKVCKNCNGTGYVMKMRQVGPGMIQQMQTTCPVCKGNGHTVKMKKDRKVLEVLVEKGMKNNSKIKFQGEADETPGHIPGDVIFVVQEKKHSVFTRKGCHLIIEKTINLSEALTGCSILIKHLDGRKLLIKTKSDEIIKPGSLKRIQNEGMPTHGNPFVKGHLIIKFNVKFPKPVTLTENVKKSLIDILPDKPIVINAPNAEECIMDHCTTEMLKEDMEQNREAYDSDDEEENQHGRQVQCQQS